MRTSPAATPASVCVERTSGSRRAVVKPNGNFRTERSTSGGSGNVFREAHPAHELHDNASIGHLDPRLNQVRFKGKPLLRRTGATSSCRSVWGDDAIYDMVGNLDEWVDDEGGVFLGGFYARSTKAGCDQRISSHPANYYDYSLGVRCCRDL